MLKIFSYMIKNDLANGILKITQNKQTTYCYIKLEVISSNLKLKLCIDDQVLINESVFQKTYEKNIRIVSKENLKNIKLLFNNSIINLKKENKISKNVELSEITKSITEEKNEYEEKIVIKENTNKKENVSKIVGRIDEDIRLKHIADLKDNDSIKKDIKNVKIFSEINTLDKLLDENLKI